MVQWSSVQGIKESECNYFKESLWRISRYDRLNQRRHDWIPWMGGRHVSRDLHSDQRSDQGARSTLRNLRSVERGTSRGRPHAYQTPKKVILKIIFLFNSRKFKFKSFIGKHQPNPRRIGTFASVKTTSWWSMINSTVPRASTCRLRSIRFSSAFQLT